MTLRKAESQSISKRARPSQYPLTPTTKAGATDYFRYTFKTRKALYYLVGPLLSTSFDIMWKIKYIGRERVPRRNVIFMPNHISHLDGFLVGKGFFPQRKIHALADEKLFKHPLSSWFLSNLNAFPVRKGAKQIHVVKYAIELVKRGKDLLWFPEGQRHKQPWMRTLNPGRLGAGWIAHATRAPIIPVFIDGAELAMPVGKMPTKGPGFRKIKITVEYGRPVPLEDYYDLPQGKEASQLIVNRIMEAIEEMRPAYHYKEREQLMLEQLK